MGIRCGDDLYLSLVLQFLVNRNHVLDDGESFVEHDLYVSLGKIAALVYERLERQLRQEIRIEPRQIEEGLQVAEILFAEGLYQCR